MRNLYSSPLRVYLLLGSLAILGILCGLKLPVSLFPNSSKPSVHVFVAYGGGTAQQFLDSYGAALESQLKGISGNSLEVETLDAEYGSSVASYTVKFKWGVDPDEALKEVERVAQGFSGRLPTESRDSLSVRMWRENSGFFALSFYSPQRDLLSLYHLLEPIVTPRVNKVTEAENPFLFNPLSQEVRVELIPEAVAALQLFPKDIEAAVMNAMGSSTGGALTTPNGSLSVEIPRQVENVEALGRIPVPTPGGKSVHLSDIAKIDLAPRTDQSRIFKTDGTTSLILFAAPKPGGNVKKMSEDLLKAVQDLMPSLPSDIQYKVLVDPSQFIRSAVNNVFHEVCIAALLAVIVLFVFIGSVRNVATAAIEIPISMVMAFILMRIFGINLNLISLAGLALSAGMNVDASVVVMENIFRHFDLHKGPLTHDQKLDILMGAVNEVKFPIIASTIASLVVFAPLAMTSDLTYAILGDLALAVVFSHAFSAVVALILVPTVRLHLMSGAKEEAPHKSKIENQLMWLENKYSQLLETFVSRPILKKSVYLGALGVLAVLVVFVLPKLPREIVGKPDTDWMVLSMNVEGNTRIRQMELQLEEFEKNFMKEYSQYVQYTFAQINSIGNGTLMARLKDKGDMRKLHAEWEKKYAHTPTIHYWVGPWNPSELPIPDPSDIKLAIQSGTAETRMNVANQLENLILDSKIYKNVSTNPSASRQDTIEVVPRSDQWSLLQSQGSRFSLGDIADHLRVASQGRRVGQINIGTERIDIQLRYPFNYLEDIEGISSFPVGIGSKMVPLKALADVRRTQAAPPIFRQNEREVFFVEAKSPSSATKAEIASNQQKAGDLIHHWEKQLKEGSPEKSVSIVAEDPATDLNNAIEQLTIAIVLSVVLIFLTMTIQFGSIIEPLIVLVSVPLGLIGVITSLFVFRSTLSLNAALGVILLNGIAVANSIILVDFIKRLRAAGHTPKEAAVLAAKTRLRPILITSLTTVLGMLPIALGFGEGGRILQPLGITVSAGLWISMLLTLFLVPALHVSYLESQAAGRTSLFSFLSKVRLPRRYFRSSPTAEGVSS